jgi:GTP cyclohydrolase II
MPTGVHLSPENTQYLTTKVLRGAHTLDLPPTGSLGSA